MEKATGGAPESPTRRAARIARVGARYGFGFVFGGRRLPRRRADAGRIGPRLRLSLEELGPTFAEFGRFLSARGDLIPPDVAAELARAAAPAAPIPFAETRAAIERELDNTLERLFVRFEETPVRTGPFTQAHRAVLPGERPALVVVGRPGIRRDLLAMRPVADLTRRRIGQRLPLDPNLSVSEFAAHVNHRRDMFFAARISRRLRAMDGFALRVPEIYRSLSTGRCATFEAPADPRALDAAGDRAVAEALVRLALTEGIFLADPAPGRFAVDGRGDVAGPARALPLAGGSVPRADADLRRELRETLGSLGGPLWEEHSLAVIRARSLEALRRGGAKLHDEVAQAAHAVVAAEGFSGKETRAAVEAAEALVSHHRDPARVAARTARRLAQPDTFADYPRQVHALLDELKDGEVEVRFRHAGLDDLIGRVDILANRLVFALLIAALIIGSSMLGIFVEGGLQLLGVSVFGFVGFVFAAVLGLLLLVGIVRS